MKILLFQLATRCRSVTVYQSTSHNIPEGLLSLVHNSFSQITSRQVTGPWITFQRVRCLETIIRPKYIFTKKFKKNYISRFHLEIFCRLYKTCLSQSLRSLRRGSTAVRLLVLGVWILLGAYTFVCVECCVLSGRGSCDGSISLPEQSYRVWFVSMSVTVKR